MQRKKKIVILMMAMLYYSIKITKQILIKAIKLGLNSKLKNLKVSTKAVNSIAKIVHIKAICLIRKIIMEANQLA